jgi:hypothetical protein
MEEEDLVKANLEDLKKNNSNTKAQPDPTTPQPALTIDPNTPVLTPTPGVTIPDPGAVATTTPDQTTLTVGAPAATPKPTTLTAGPAPQTTLTPHPPPDEDENADDEKAAKNKEEKNYLRRMWDYLHPRKANFQKPEELGSGMEAFWKALFKLLSIAVSLVTKNALGIALYPFGSILDMAGRPGLLAFSRKCMDMDVLDPNPANSIKSKLTPDVNQPLETQVKADPENNPQTKLNTDLTNNQTALTQLQNNPTPAGPNQAQAVTPQADAALGNTPAITLPPTQGPAVTVTAEVTPDPNQQKKGPSI